MDNLQFPPTKGQWECPNCSYANHELRVKCRNCFQKRPPEKGELLTAEEVMEEVAKVASAPVMAALRITFEGKFRSDLKGIIPEVVLRDLGLEPVTLYRRKVPKEEAPVYKRQKDG